MERRGPRVWPPAGKAASCDAPLGGGPAGALLANGVAAAAAWGQGAAELVACLAAIAPLEADLDPFQRGVLEHLRAIAAWRGEHRPARASWHLEEALAHLAAAGSAEANAYAGRVHDSLGMLLGDWGLLDDARHAFECALAAKRAEGDADAIALTQGNLGRLCLALGAPAEAAAHLGDDLAHVERTQPGATRLRAQLGTEWGTALDGAGHGAAARAAFAAALALARAAEDAIGQAFAWARLGLSHARGGAVAAARTPFAEAKRLLEGLPAEARPELRALVGALEAALLEADGQFEQAALALERTAGYEAAAPRMTALDRAGTLEGRARLATALGRPAEAVRHLRCALRLLDATSAREARRRIESALRTSDPNAWLLHGAGRYVGHDEIERLLDEAGEEEAPGREVEAVVLFADLRGFTREAERHPPALVVAALNGYLTRMTRCIEEFGGRVDKFIGDAVMAVFVGESTRADERSDAADRAALAALAMQTEIRRFNRLLAAPLLPFRAGIGIHAGRAIAGLVGSPQRRSHTLLGDVVNTAARLEGMTKTLGAQILLSGAAADRLARPEALHLLPLGAFRPTGREASVEVLLLAGERDASQRSAALLAATAGLERAQALLREDRRDEAAAACVAAATTLATAGLDTAAGLDACRRLAASTLPHEGEPS